MVSYNNTYTFCFIASHDVMLQQGTMYSLVECARATSFNTLELILINDLGNLIYLCWRVRAPSWRSTGFTCWIFITVLPRDPSAAVEHCFPKFKLSPDHELISRDSPG